MLRKRTSFGSRLFLWGALTLLLVSACRTTGVPSTGRPVAPDGGSVVDLTPGTDEGGALVVAAGPSEVVVGEVDEILYSRTSVDPVLQRAASSRMNEWIEERAETFETYLARMQRYGLAVDEEIELRALPRSLRYLPLVESGYSPVAVSPVGATGLWQLMGPTARELGLTVNSIVDDRRDPAASTGAALDYLESLYDEFDSWLLALAAYNGGPGRVRRALGRSGIVEGEVDAGSSGRQDDRFLQIRRHLPRETREFIPRFLAAAALAENPEVHGLSLGESAPIVYDEVRVPDATSLDVVALAAGVTENEVRRLNPHFVRGHTPLAEPRTVRVPVGTAPRFEMNFAEILPEERLGFLEHIVLPGETFSHIAQIYGVPVLELTDMNGQVDPRRLQIGMSVMVPVGGRASGRTIADD